MREDNIDRKFDKKLYPRLKHGISTVKHGTHGQSFEKLECSDSLTALGVADRSIVPNEKNQIGYLNCKITPNFETCSSRQILLVRSKSLD